MPSLLVRLRARRSSPSPNPPLARSPSCRSLASSEHSAAHTASSPLPHLSSYSPTLPTRAFLCTGSFMYYRRKLLPRIANRRLETQVESKLRLYHGKMSTMLESCFSSDRFFLLHRVVDFSISPFLEGRYIAPLIDLKLCSENVVDRNYIPARLLSLLPFIRNLKFPSSVLVRARAQSVCDKACSREQRKIEVSVRLWITLRITISLRALGVLVSNRRGRRVQLGGWSRSFWKMRLFWYCRSEKKIAGGAEREARSEKRGARSEERRARGEGRGARGEKRGARGERREARSEGRETRDERRVARGERRETM